jgi:DNA-binding transcriptional ArsR family regulator
MDEIVVRLTRALASRPRLRVLSWLSLHGETAPTLLADRLKLSLNVLSSHLRTLSSVGLIQGRRSGAKCYYDFRSPYGEQTFSGGMSRWLKGLLKAVDGRKDNCELREVRNYPPCAQQPALHAVIFEAATAFTDLRRLQILRHLETSGRATVEELVVQLRMSAFAVSRQTAKLRRRGFLEARQKAGRQLVFRLAGNAKTPIHGRMLEIVRATWRKKT